MKSNKRLLLIAAIPILIVNLIATSGQWLYIRYNWDWPLIPSIGAAIAIESIAVYLAYMHHESLMAEDAAYGLRLGSIGMGVLAGLMNYTHYSPHWDPTSKGIILGTLSASSPVLWNIYSKRVSRDDLKAKGLIEPRSVKLGLLKYMLFPRSSFGVFRMAVWNGENRPAVAIQNWETIREAHEIAKDAQEQAEIAEREASESRMTLDTAKTRADKVRVALRDSNETTASAIARWLYDRGHPGISAAYIRQVRAVDARKQAIERRENIRALPPAGETDI